VCRKPGKSNGAGRYPLLDEIGDLPWATQARLLHVLQERCIERWAGVRRCRWMCGWWPYPPGSWRVVLRQLRADLFYRLHVLPIRVPSLRDGPRTCPAALHFACRTQQRWAILCRRWGGGCWRGCRARSWPGNVRELEHVMQRAVVRSQGGLLRPEHLVEERPARRYPGRGAARSAGHASGEEVALLPESEEGAILRWPNTSGATWRGCWPTPGGDPRPTRGGRAAGMKPTRCAAG